ncbi:unnamed protein product [Candidula unifasciata]|uniref:XLR/SYCP3/FAM9 domain-containing protein n=1 Tax=Candidula unifasciata TaxID=100452 RepID=A0A8S4A3T5_9EUPU|nr:unnamed protein product [Candidula unifasciata]
MPKAKKLGDNQPPVKRHREDLEDELNIHSEGSSPVAPQQMQQRDTETPLVIPAAAGKKRIADVDYDPNDFSHEMQKMLEGFGADISKTLSNKRKRMEQLTQASLKNTNKKLEEVWKTQQQARNKLQDEFSKQVNSVYQQWELDIDKIKEQEEKLNTLFKQQQKLFQQSRIVQCQRLKTVKELCEQFIKGLEELESNRQSQQASLQAELKKEMQLLQKRILMDTQQQEMANMRKSLHSMLF